MRPLPESPDTDKLAEDFNHIFAVILGFAELAATEQHLRGDAKLARYIDEIRKCARHGEQELRQWIGAGGASEPKR